MNCPTKGCNNHVPLHTITYYRAPYIKPKCHACTVTELMSAKDTIDHLRKDKARLVCATKALPGILKAAESAVDFTTEEHPGRWRVIDAHMVFEGIAYELRAAIGAAKGGE